MGKLFFLQLIAMSIFFGCAKKGSPTGGFKDSIAPQVKSFSPENYSVKFTGQKIEIDFDEYIKLKNIKEELVVSPPLAYNPILSPQTSSRTLKVTLLDTLLDQTTYVLHFGNSIVDNNEENVLPQFKYVFSTGTYLDSLSMKGQIRSALDPDLDGPVTVMLYPAQSMTDSTIYSVKPLYVATARESDGQFQFTNLKEGNYFITAIKEDQNNYTFESKTDMIGFSSQLLTLPLDSIGPLVIFEENPDFEWTRATHSAKNRIVFGFKGERGTKDITPLFETPLNQRQTWTQDPDVDSLNYWFDPPFNLESRDTLWFSAKTNQGIDTLSVQLKDLYPDSLKVTPLTRGVFSPKDSIRFTASTPLRKINRAQIHVLDKDSTEIQASAILDSLRNILTLGFDIKDENRYVVTIKPKAFTDFFGQTHDTLSYVFKTKPLSDYGTLNLNFSGTLDCPILIELVNTNLKVVNQSWISSSTAENIYFDYINPDKYRVRITLDCNENRLWDTGDYDLKRQPERVYYLPGVLDIRANWSLNELFDLSIYQ